MSTSEAQIPDQSFLDSLCDRLEAALSKKACVTLQKAVDDTVCASLKHGMHRAIQQGVERHGPGETARNVGGTKASDVCASLEEVTGNAVCAALKQVVSDTVCKALADAISTSIHNALRREHEVPFHVTPEALNISLEEVTGNAVCAALKQVVSDTVCKALKKAIAESTAFVLSEGQAPPPLSETLRADASLADADQLYLGSDEAWHIRQPDTNAELCAAANTRVTKEVCSRLQQLAASILCARLKKAIREEIREHAERCEEDKGAERSPGRGAARSLLTYKTGMMVVAMIAVAAVAIAAAAPGTPFHLWPAASGTTLTLVSSRPSIDPATGNVQLTGVLTTGGNGVAGQTISLQRQSGDAWATLGSVVTRSDGSFSFQLRRESFSATVLQTFSDPRITREANNSPSVSSGGLSIAKATTGQNHVSSSKYLFVREVMLGATIDVVSPPPPSQPNVGDQITLHATVANPYNLTYEWSITDPSNNNVNHSDQGNTSSFTAEQSGNYTVDVDVFDVNGMLYSGSTSVTVAPQAPTANIQLSPPPYAVNSTITLDGSQSSGAITSYAWSVSSAPSGSSAGISSSTAANASFTPDQPGDYTIQLTVTGGGGSQGTANTTVTVSPNPSPSVTSPSPSVTSPSPSERQSQGQPNATIVIPRDPSPSPNGHSYRAVFEGSTQLAACASASVIINDNNSTQSISAETLPKSAPSRTVLVLY